MSIQTTSVPVRAAVTKSKDVIKVTQDAFGLEGVKLLRSAPLTDYYVYDDTFDIGQFRFDEFRFRAWYSSIFPDAPISDTSPIHLDIRPGASKGSLLVVLSHPGSPTAFLFSDIRMICFAQS